MFAQMTDQLIVVDKWSPMSCIQRFHVGRSNCWADRTLILTRMDRCGCQMKWLFDRQLEIGKIIFNFILIKTMSTMEKTFLILIEIEQRNKMLIAEQP